MAKTFGTLRNTSELGLDDQFTFGRHIGYTVLEVIKDRPTYISWLMANTGLKFTTSVHQELFRHIKKHVPQHTKRRYTREYYEYIDDDPFDDVPF